MEKSDRWPATSDGKPRGYIQPSRLEELWFHTGTSCNLSCPFCLEGSKPGDDRIQFLLFQDAGPWIDEALELGVEKFSFTGGEPFVNPHFPGILSYALDRRPCLVLTNATEPLRNRMDKILPLLEKPNPLSFRVSLDHPDPEKHDESRGRGNFRKALDTLGRLHKSGFGVSLARLSSGFPDEAYRPFLEEAGLPTDIRIVTFPDLQPPGALPEVPEITENCMTTYLDEDRRGNFMCNFSKMVVKIDGRVSVYACTLVDDDPDFDLGESLAEAMKKRVMLKHHRCYSCFAFGASCSER